MGTVVDDFHDWRVERSSRPLRLAVLHAHFILALMTLTVFERKNHFERYTPFC